MTYLAWDDDEWPLAYLITIRTYGTWLHGDQRSSVDLRGQNLYDTPKVQPNEKLTELMARNMTDAAFLMNGRQRAIAEAAIREVCSYRSYGLHAINVRTNHSHSVVAAGRRPERIATEFKSYATRNLRQEKLVGGDQPIWSRGESTRYLWKEQSVEQAIDYVVNGQGDDLPNF